MFKSKYLKLLENFSFKAYHKVAGNGKLDGLKNALKKQSAAKIRLG
jgi:hypothetical protein